MGIPIDRGRPLYTKKETRSLLLPQPPSLPHDMVDAVTSRTMPSRSRGGGGGGGGSRISEGPLSNPLAFDRESGVSTEGGFLNLANIHNEALAYSREDQILFHQFFETVFQGRDPPGHHFLQRSTTADPNVNPGTRRVRHLPSSRSSTRWQSAIFSGNEAAAHAPNTHASSFAHSGSSSNREHSVWRIAPLRRPSSPPSHPQHSTAFSSYDHRDAPFIDLSPPLVSPSSSVPILEELSLDEYSNASSHSSSLEAPFILQSSFVDR